MPAFKVTFAKIVGSPTTTHWSQVYSAGSLYAVLSLAKKDEEKELSLSVAGKGILNNIEAEFFTLEEKSLAKIKEALTNALSSTPEDITISLACGYLKDDVMYLFTVGNASALVKRNGKTAVVLTGEDKKATRQIHASSGYAKEKDVFFLHTDAFTSHASEKAITDALAMESINDAAEELTPHVHDKEAGDAAAIFMEITPPLATPDEDEFLGEAGEESPGEEKGDDTPEPDLAPRVEETTKEELVAHTETPTHEAEKPDEESSRPSLPRFAIPSFQIPQKRVIVLTVALILALALGGSIFAAQQNREQQKISAAYKEVYEKAQKDYEVGESLEGLNKAVAQDNFLKAKKTLEENRGKFKEGSKERTELEAFLVKINDKLGDGGGTGEAVATKAVPDSESPVLSVLKEEGALASVATENAIFYLTEDAIMKTDNKGEDAEEAHKNDDNWSEPRGIGAFGSNLYVLDRSEGVLKLSAGAEGYGVSSYFKGEKPELGTAQDIAIDGSVYILLKNGSILKYTRGEKESFTISALQKTLSSPTRIVTNEDSESLFVLDNGNSRIVSLDKNGTFKKAYATPLAAKATGLAVNETDKKIFLLSGDKIYELSM